MLIRGLFVFSIAAVLLVPTGMCLCADHEEESANEQHQPGCPKVRKLERSAGPENYIPDAGVVELLSTPAMLPRNGPARRVQAVGHGPPRGSPLYIELKTLLI
jgi:hypothetical protein